MATIGIDLGTTNSCLAVVKDGKPEVIPNDVGHRTTPSVISILNGAIKVGEAAKTDSTRHPQNVVYGLKHILGRKYDDPYVHTKMKEFIFPTVFQDKKVKIVINNKEDTDNYLPEELSGFILKKLKEYAEAYIKTEVDNAVITVPTHFNDSQRQATMDAGKLAGFKEIKLLDEPTAAAIAYGVDNEYTEGTILVYDFGGGTFDVSIIKYADDQYTTLAIDGDLKMGGDDVDTTLFKYFENIIQQSGNANVTDKRFVARLRNMCEHAKKSLSSKSSTDVELYLLSENGDDDKDYELTRTQFEELNKDLFQKSIDILDRCLTSKKMSKDSINSILLVGGSTRIRNVVERIEKYIGKPVKSNINPDEAVALGAAIYGSKWAGKAYDNLKINVICSYSLGVKVKGDKMSVIIPKHSPIPHEYVKEYKTVPAGNPTAKIQIYSGDSLIASENTLLGNLVIGNIVNGPKGTVVTVTLSVDEDGMLKAKAVDQDGKSNHLDITLDKGNLTSCEIDELVVNIKKRFDISNELARSGDTPVPPPPPPQQSYSTKIPPTVPKKPLPQRMTVLEELSNKIKRK